MKIKSDGRLCVLKSFFVYVMILPTGSAFPKRSCIKCTLTKKYGTSQAKQSFDITIIGSVTGVSMRRFTTRDFEKWMILEDEDFLAVHKPAGIAVQTASVTSMDLENMAKGYLGGGYVGVVHRLDQPVEGIVLLAKNKAAASGLDRQIAQGRMTKDYVALCYDPLERSVVGEKVILQDELIRDGSRNLSLVVPPGTKDARQARLSYEVWQSRKENPFSKVLLGVRLMTGRHHQIRVQLAHAKLPIVGDTKYGNEEGSDRTDGLALCAASLSFVHPRMGNRVHLRVLPWGAQFAPFLDEIKNRLEYIVGLQLSL